MITIRYEMVRDFDYDEDGMHLFVLYKGVPSGGTPVFIDWKTAEKIAKYVANREE
jgi:hypothetical protein